MINLNENNFGIYLLVFSKENPRGGISHEKGAAIFQKNVEFGQKSLSIRSKKLNYDQKMIQIAAFRQIYLFYAIHERLFRL
jgi:hypothetical protein